MLAAILLISVLLMASLANTRPWSLVEARVFDILSTVRPPPLSPGAPIIVAIDEPAMAEIGRQWPWPRNLHARLVENLRSAGARVIALDIVFADPTSAEADAALAAALGPDVVLAADETVISGAHAVQHIRVEPLLIFTQTGARSGIVTIALDSDGVLRRLPSYVDGFARQVLALAEEGTYEPRRGLLRMFGPARTFTTVSYYQALDPEAFLPEGFFRDRIVIVGLSLQTAPTTETGGADAYATSMTFWNGRLTAGAELQATMMENLRVGLLVSPAPKWLSLLAIATAGLLAAVGVLWRTGWDTVAIAAGAVVAFFGASFALLELAQYYVAPAAPALAYVLVAAAQGGRDYAAERRQRRAITRAFSQYLSPVLVERLASDPAQLKLGGELRTLTILFTDVRGFTSIAEQMKNDPQRLTLLVNRLLNPLSRIVLDAGGTIDKYMGDCLMAFWNAPLDEPLHAEKAVSAALLMLTALDELNRELAQESPENAIRLGIGIGINTGQCIVGNMGSDVRFDYTAIGDAVNLASRLEGATRDHATSLLMGPETAALVSHRFPVRPIAEITVKGRTEAMPVFTIDGVRSG